MKVPLRILHLEDDRQDAELIQATLAAGDFFCDVDRVETEAEFLAAIGRGGFDLILVNYSLSSFDGAAALVVAKGICPDVPLIFVSENLGEELMIETLKSGATDYVLKQRLSRLVPAVQRALQEAENRKLSQQAQRALRESEERTRLIVQNALDAVVTVDARGLFTEWNPQAEIIFGWRREEIIGKPLADTIIPQQYREAHRRGFERLLTTGKGPILNMRIEITALHRDGREFPVELTVLPFRSPNDFAFSAFIRNLTERKRAEEETRRNFDRIRALHEIDSAITSTLDLQSVLYVLLENMDRFLSSPAASGIHLVNQETGILEPVATRKVSLEEWKVEMLRSGVEFGKEVMQSRAPLVMVDVRTDPRTRFIELLRKYRLVSYLGVPLVAKDQCLGVLGYFTTEKHVFSEEEIEFLTTLASQAAIAIHNAQLYEQTQRQAAALKIANESLQRREQIQAILKELSQDITKMDLKSLLQKLTDKVFTFMKVDISDIRIEEELGTRVMAVSGANPEKIQSAQSRDRSRWSNFTESSKPVIVADLSIQGEPNRQRTLRRLGIRGYMAAPLLSRRGRLLGVLRALSYQPRDFTQEETEFLQQLANGAAVAIENAQLYHDLEKSNQVKTEFLSVMSYELRTPLNVIIGYTSMLLDGVLGEVKAEHKDWPRRITEQSWNLLAMIENIQISPIRSSLTR